MAYLAPLESLFNVKFPLFVATKYTEIDQVYSKEGYKVMRAMQGKIAKELVFDFFVDDVESTYYGRLTHMNNLKVPNLIEYDYYFENLAHYIAHRPKGENWPKDIIIADATGALYRKGKIYGIRKIAKLKKYKHPYAFVYGYTCPLWIPTLPLVQDVLETYKEDIFLEVVEVSHTLFFRNIHDKFSKNLADRQIRIL